MNTQKLYDILRETCGQLRKGESVIRTPGTPSMPIDVTEIYMMPKDDDPAFDGFAKVDMHFVTVAVNKAKAEARRDDLIAVLNSWPDPVRLAGGPSYIEVGGVIGDQGAAFELFALGKVLGIWDVITPESMGATGSQAREMAGSGFIMCTGYRRARRQKAAA